MTRFTAIVMILRAGEKVELPKDPVPVTLGFDPRDPPLGSATLRIEGDKVLGDFEVRDDVPIDSLYGRYPAVGGIVRTAAEDISGRIESTIDVRTVGICNGQNANVDPEIEPLKDERKRRPE